MLSKVQAISVMNMCETSFPADLTAAAMARRFVIDSGVVPAPSIDDVVLLVSELATNAVKHAEARSIGIKIRRTGNTLRIDVVDDGPGFEDPTATPPQIGSGMGLRLVQRLASRWGIDSDELTTVWFELEGVGS